MRKAIVVGGGLSGLFAALMLRSIGWYVEVYEKSKRAMDNRGAGMVLQPEVTELLQRVGLNAEALPTLGVQELVVLDRNGLITRRSSFHQRYTSWSLLHSLLRSALPETSYYPAFNLESVEVVDDKVRARFDNGHMAMADLLVGADGSSSSVRQLLFPGVRVDYAGYVAWRGVVQVQDLPDVNALLHDRLVFYERPESHFVCYPVPRSAVPWSLACLTGYGTGPRTSRAICRPS
jgi:2-polyprenyl-6-methoxyphenol hydroxylase-like FAD-dependent oxidoreductase